MARAGAARREAILTLKKANPLSGARRIKEELRRMGIAVSEPTIQKVLREHGFYPRGGRPRNSERFKSPARDALSSKGRSSASSA